MSPDAASIAHAVCELENGRFDLRARSPDFLSDWLPLAEQVCRGFGTPPAGISCSGAVYAQPFGPRHVAVVQVADRAARGLNFRLIVLPRHLYSGWIADPYLVADRFPPDWTASGDLPSLAWPPGPPAQTTIAQLDNVLQTGGSQTLLGAVQALVDGGRLVFERPAPAAQLLRDLWQLLPYSTRAELWPATFACGNDLAFDVLVVHKLAGMALDRYLTEEQAVDYPEGRYELSLQYAVEHGDQREVDRLLHRRSSRQTLRLVLYLLVGGVLAYVAMNLLGRFL